MREPENIIYEKRLKIRWLMLSFAFVATVMNYVDRLAFNYLSASGPLREMIPDDAFGYIATAFFVAYLLSNLVSGFIIDKLGTRLGYSLCMAFWTSAALLHALATAPFHFGIFRFLLGIGEAGNWPSAIKLTNEWFPPEERSTAIGIFNSGGAVGAIVAPPIVGWMGIQYGWQSTFIVMGALGYLWLAAFWFTYYTPGYSLKEAKARIIPPAKLIRTRFVSWFFISKVFIDPVWYFITFWIGRYLIDVHHWSLATMAWAAMIPFIAADLGNILGGLFTQWIISRGVAIAAARKIACGIFGLLMVLSLIIGPLVITGPQSALVVLSLAGFGYAAYTGNSMAFPGDVVPQSAVASVWGLASVGAGLGGTIFQSISGVAVKSLSTSHDYTIAYNAVFVGYGTAALIGVVIVLFVMGPLKKNDYLHGFVRQNENLAA